MSEFNIRMATLSDAEAILAIYNPYIMETAITFEYDPVTLDEFKERMRKVQAQFPWLVCEQEDAVVGYAYCSLFKERAAFAWDCESTVYLKETAYHQGIATALYTKLFELVKEQGYYNIYALITNLNESSVALHRKFGFNEVGIYRNTGFKMGQWWDLLVMEKRLRSSEEIPKKVKAIHEIS